SLAARQFTRHRQRSRTIYCRQWRIDSAQSAHRIYRCGSRFGMERIRKPDRDHTDSLTDPISDILHANNVANIDLHTDLTYTDSCDTASITNSHARAGLPDDPSYSCTCDCYFACDDHH